MAFDLCHSIRRSLEAGEPIDIVPLTISQNLLDTEKMAH